MKARTFFVKEGEPDFLTENRLQKTFRKRKSYRPYPCFPFLISLFAPLFLFQKINNLTSQPHVKDSVHSSLHSLRSVGMTKGHERRRIPSCQKGCTDQGTMVRRNG